MRYDIKFIQASIDDEWRSIINHESRNDNDSWYIKNRTTIGGSKWLLYHRILPAILLTIVLRLYYIECFIILFLFFYENVIL